MTPDDLGWRKFPAPSSELAFLKAGGVNVAVEDLIKLNEFSRSDHGETEIDIKERSLQIFGDEKRLDSLRATTLLRDDRLTLRALRCYTVAEPLGWERGRIPQDLCS